MIQGTMSGAGKSLLCAGLCRVFKQDGYRVAPYKSQNMALNSFITRDGLEMGRAQVMQAEACGIEPDVRMNPILLKPSSDVGSQVIVLGKILRDMDAAEYFQYKQKLVPEVVKAYNELAEDNDIIVIEGAGSPAEINLNQQDLVNMGLARMVDAPVLLAGDIDRGGVFAQLYGTVGLLNAEDRSRIKGMVINKFRGDKNILMPGVEMIEEKVGIPVVGIVPFMYVDIDEEDSLASRLSRKGKQKEGLFDIAILRLPRLSNFTDFSPLEGDPLLSVRYVDQVNEFGNPDVLILPGTKNTMDDLIWIRENGLEMLVRKYAAAGGLVIGICGGYQMLGRELRNPEQVEGTFEYAKGIGLLPTSTVFTKEKTRTRVKGQATTGIFKSSHFDAYEIHMGKTLVEGEAFALLEDGKPDGCVSGNVYGTYLHGLFDTGEVTEALVRELCRRNGISYEERTPVSHNEYAQKQYNILADGIRESMDMDKIYDMMR